MSYTKHNYKKGDELLASQLNEMDDQIALNEENLNVIVQTDEGINIFDGNYDESGYIKNGVDTPAPKSKRTSQYYPIDSSKEYVYIYHADYVATLGVIFYDSNKTWISNTAASNVGATKRAIPPNAAYFRSYTDVVFTGDVSLSYVPVDSFIPYQEAHTIRVGVIDFENFNQDTKDRIVLHEEKVDAIIQSSEGINIFDGNYDESGYIKNGVDTPATNYKRTSQYYPIDSSKGGIYIYHADELGTLGVIFYDSSKTWISNTAANNTGLTLRPIPSNAAYFRSYTDVVFTGDVSFSYVSVDSFIPYQKNYTIKDDVIDFENFNQETKQKVFSWLSGKTIVFMGDSIIGNFYDTTGVAYKLSQLTGATVINCAFGGTQMALRSSSSTVIQEWNKLSGCKLADAIYNNNFTDQDTALENITNEPAYFAERLATLKSVDWNNVDVVMWNYGTNDFQNNNTIIKDTSDLTLLTSFYGAYCHTIETLLTKYPHLRIIPVTPMWRFWKTGDEYLDGADEHLIGGRLLPEFCNCAIEVSKKYHLPYIDLYNSLDANPWTRTAYFETDPVHPSENGRERIANKIAHTVLSLL